MVTSWLLLLSIVQFSSAHSIHARATRCYTDLGCFSSYADVPAPQSPTEIATTFRLHVRGTSNSYNLESLHYKTQINNWMSHFDSSKPTKVLIHGFLDSGTTAWMPHLANELLKKVCLCLYVLFCLLIDCLFHLFGYSG